MNRRERQVEEFVRTAPDGVTKHEVAALLGVAAVTAAKYLFEVRKAGGGIASTEHSGPLARWCATERRDELREKGRWRRDAGQPHSNCETKGLE